MSDPATPTPPQPPGFTRRHAIAGGLCLVLLIAATMYASVNWMLGPNTSSTETRTYSTHQPYDPGYPTYGAPEPSADASITPTPTPTGSGLTITCSGYNVGGPFTSIEAAWADKGQLSSCKAAIKQYTATASERSATQAYLDSKTYYGSDGFEGALMALIGICAAKDVDAEIATRSSDKNAYPYALQMCPTHPNAGLLKGVTEGTVVTDGNFIVGKTIQPGTYRSQPKVTNCYWERTTANGQTIDNGFATFAADGVHVTIAATDGSFTSKNCLAWRKIG